MSICAKHQSSSLIPNSDALHLHLLTVADNITCAFFITATYLFQHTLTKSFISKYICNITRGGGRGHWSENKRFNTELNSLHRRLASLGSTFKHTVPRNFGKSSSFTEAGGSDTALCTELISVPDI